MNRRARRVLMIGPGERMPGGMSAVIQTYRAAGLFDEGSVCYLSSYEGAAALTQLRTFGRVVLRLLATLALRRIDVLHVHSASRGSFWRKSVLCWLARLFGVPYVFHLHSGEFSDFYAAHCGRRARAWARRTLARASLVLVLTPSWISALRAIEPAANLAVLLNPVVLPPWQAPRPGPGRRILFLGRVREKKGAYDLLQAFALLHQRMPGVFLQLAGDGELDVARQLAESLALPSDCYELSGWVDGQLKAQALAAADVFVLPSYFEGLPIGILEAMAAGVVVVASRVGGIPDVLRDGENGLLVAPGDRQGLAAALQLSLGDHDLRLRLSIQAREDASAHDHHRIASELLRFYEVAANGGAR
ncbi:glycosyltransferase family 4 protein [Roseateles violae]|uniref:Glycosyltransferase family 4 protein n=1 Tax=Roseateles violae TaxID=3058042 RepID=A0ABT8DVD4_9BURK|nr:glycosyltransferase family 4 protein [Pelomonas sp. PFR6]MDN3920854.1 glycosyltransferase family 4 protein [Pelomonas sp. PFR6]